MAHLEKTIPNLVPINCRWKRSGWLRAATMTV